MMGVRDDDTCLDHKKRYIHVLAVELLGTQHLKQQRELVEGMMWKGEGEFQNKKI